MQFIRTERKIRELNQHFNALQTSKNVDDFETNFAAFLASGRSVTLALQIDGGISFDEGKIKNVGEVEGFAEWYQRKQQEMQTDELCKFFKNTRDIDIHTGNTAIISDYTIKGPVTLSAPTGGSLVIGARGTYEIYNGGTPQELKVQKSLGKEEIFKIGLEGAPRKHKGADISGRYPKH